MLGKDLRRVNLVHEDIPLAGRLSDIDYLLRYYWDEYSSKLEHHILKIKGTCMSWSNYVWSLA